MNKYTKDMCIRAFDNCDVSDLKNKTILVTGSNGLLGGFVSNFLKFLNEEHSYNIEIFLTSFSRTSNLKEGSNITYIQQDLSKSVLNHTGLLSFILQTKKIDYCFYCAGYAQPFKFLEKTTETFFINTKGFHQVSKYIFDNNKNAKSVFVSSAEVYAHSGNDTQHLETDNINFSMDYKRNQYQLSKFAGEMISNEFRNLGYDSKSVRVSACYGPGQVSNDRRVMSDLVGKGFSESSTINLLDDGNATRKYLHLSDFCTMLMNVVIRGEKEVYNLTGDRDVSIYEMASYVGEWFCKKVNKGNGEGSFAPKKVNISIQRYIDEFGNIEFYRFDEGLRDYIHWYSERFSN